MIDRNTFLNSFNVLHASPSTLKEVNALIHSNNSNRRSGLLVFRRAVLVCVLIIVFAFSAFAADADDAVCCAIIYSFPIEIDIIYSAFPASKLAAQIVCLLKHLIRCGNYLGIHFVSTLCHNQVYHFIHSLYIRCFQIFGKYSGCL